MRSANLLSAVFFLLLLTNSLFAVSIANAKELKIGVLAFRGNLSAVKRWQPTAAYLSEQLPEHVFRIVPLGLDQMRAAVSRREVDFIITNTGQYVELEVFYGISRIATQKNLVKGKVQTKFGAVIFVRADRNDIKTLEDLKGKSLMGVQESGFGGFQMAWRELLRHGVDPYRDLSSLSFSGFPQGAVAYAVREGHVDAGTFRSESLERMEREGKINLADFRVLNPQPMDEYPVLHSTALYPTWPFAKLKHVPINIAEQVAVSLYRMPADHPAAKSAQMEGWTIPLSYQDVHQLLMDLRVGPYAGIGQFTLMDFVSKYTAWLLLTILVISVMIGLSIGLVRENRHRKHVEHDLRLHQNHLREMVHERTKDVVRIRDQAMKASEAKSIFLSNISHELRTPLNAIIGYTEMILEEMDITSESRYLKELKKVHASAMHLMSIISKILDVTQIEDGSARLRVEMFSVSELIHEVIEAESSLASANNNLLEVRNNLSHDTIQTDRLRLQESLIHVLENACKFTENGNIEILLRNFHKSDKDWIQISIRDNGKGMTPEEQERVFEIFYKGDKTSSQKISGIGVGLAISRGYCRLMGGDITFKSDLGKGSLFIITIPSVVPMESHRAAVHATKQPL